MKSMKGRENGIGKRRAAGMLLLTAGAVFMAAGIYRGEMATVFIKAVNICLECIGIG